MTSQRKWAMRSKPLTVNDADPYHALVYTERFQRVSGCRCSAAMIFQCRNLHNQTFSISFINRDALHASSSHYFVSETSNRPRYGDNVVNLQRKIDCTAPHREKLASKALRYGSHRHSCYTANKPYLPLPRKSSPDGATTV